MVKQILFIVLFSTNAFVLKADCNCKLNVNTLTTAQSIMVLGVLGTGAVLAAPLILPGSAMAYLAAAAASAKVALCAGAAKTAVFIIPTSTAGKVGLGLTIARNTRPYIIETTEEKNNKLLKEIPSEKYTTRKEFVDCLQQNKFDSPKNTAGRPLACEDLAIVYAFVNGNAQLEQRTKAFRDGNCFCYGDNKS